MIGSICLTSVNACPADMWLWNSVLLLRAAEGMHGTPVSLSPSLFSLSHPLDEPRPVFHAQTRTEEEAGQGRTLAAKSPLQGAFRPIALSVKVDALSGALHSPGLRVISPPSLSHLYARSSLFPAREGRLAAVTALGRLGFLVLALELESFLTGSLSLRDSEKGQNSAALPLLPVEIHARRA